MDLKSLSFAFFMEIGSFSRSGFTAVTCPVRPESGTVGINLSLCEIGAAGIMEMND